MALTERPSVDAILRDVDARYLVAPSHEVAEAERRAAAVIGELERASRGMFRVVDVLEHGSLSRGTGLQNFNDIDRIAVLDDDQLATRARTRRSPADTIARMARCIADRRMGLVSMGQLVVRRQQHSVGIVYPRTGFRVDLVPGIRHENGVLIPERFTNRWIRTHPGEARARLISAAARAPDVFPAVRLLKGWRRARGRTIRLSAYATETLVVSHTNERGLSSIRDLLSEVLRRVAGQHAGRPFALDRTERVNGHAVFLADPSSGANLLEELTGRDRSRLVDACRSAIDDMDEIDALVADGAHRRAATAARRLFVGSWHG